MKYISFAQVRSVQEKQIYTHVEAMEVLEQIKEISEES
jgi:hypothetical protein